MIIIIIMMTAMMVITIMLRMMMVFDVWKIKDVTWVTDPKEITDTAMTDLIIERIR